VQKWAMLAEACKSTLRGRCRSRYPPLYITIGLYNGRSEGDKLHVRDAMCARLQLAHIVSPWPSVAPYSGCGVVAKSKLVKADQGPALPLLEVAGAPWITCQRHSGM
jgi:hypothetical protein